MDVAKTTDFLVEAVDCLVVLLAEAQLLSRLLRPGSGLVAVHELLEHELQAALHGIELLEQVVVLGSVVGILYPSACT